MKVTAWAVFASLLVTVLVAPVVAGVLGTVPIRAGEPRVPVPAHSIAPASIAPARTGRAPAPASHRPGYLVEARMGWAIS
jgi:hypothetical protein